MSIVQANFDSTFFVATSFLMKWYYHDKIACEMSMVTKINTQKALAMAFLNTTF